MLTLKELYDQNRADFADLRKLTDETRLDVAVIKNELKNHATHTQLTEAIAALHDYSNARIAEHEAAKHCQSLSPRNGRMSGRTIAALTGVIVVLGGVITVLIKYL
jgi:hypothetical protein